MGRGCASSRTAAGTGDFGTPPLTLARPIDFLDIIPPSRETSRDFVPSDNTILSHNPEQHHGVADRAPSSSTTWQPTSSTVPNFAMSCFPTPLHISLPTPALPNPSLLFAFLLELFMSPSSWQPPAGTDVPGCGRIDPRPDLGADPGTGDGRDRADATLAKLISDTAKPFGALAVLERAAGRRCWPTGW